MLRNSFFVSLFLVLWMPLLGFAQQIDPDLADDEAKADVQKVVRSETARVVTPPGTQAPSPAARSPIVVDEEELYRDLTQQWILIRRDLREFRNLHRPACEQGTDLKQNEWHFLRRVSDYITFQSERIRDTHAASEGIETFAQSKLQNMMAEQGKISLLRESQPESNDKLKSDLAMAAVNMLLADTVLQANIEDLKSGGIWNVGGVPIPRRIVISLVQDNLVIFAWYKWAKLAKNLPGLKKLAQAESNLVVKLSADRLPPICRNPKTMQACLSILSQTQRVALRGGQAIVFQGGALAASVALWSDVWSKAIEVSTWYYFRLPRWKEHFKNAVANYQNEIKDLCFYRQCYQSRLQRRVSEKRELPEAVHVFEDPINPHYQLKQYCSSFSAQRGIQ